MQANPWMLFVLLPLLVIVMVSAQSESEQVSPEGGVVEPKGLTAVPPTPKPHPLKMCMSCSAKDASHDPPRNSSVFGSCTTPIKDLWTMLPNETSDNFPLPFGFCPTVTNICYVYVLGTTIERGCGEGTKNCDNYVGPLGKSHGRCPHAFPPRFPLSEFGEVVTWSDVIPNHCRYCTCDSEKQPGCNMFRVGNYTIPTVPTGGTYAEPKGDAGTLTGITFFSLLIISLTALTAGSCVL